MIKTCKINTAFLIFFANVYYHIAELKLLSILLIHIFTDHVRSTTGR